MISTTKKILHDDKCPTKKGWGLPRSRPLWSGRTTGFTLLEMIVAIGIFLTALTIIIGALVSVNNAARKAHSEQVVADNLSAAIDSMSRSMRVGSKFHCGCGSVPVDEGPTTASDSNFPTDVRACQMSDEYGAGGDVCLAFEGQQGDLNNLNDQIVYRLNGKRIERSIQSGQSGTYVPITAPELNISTLKFFLYGTTPNDDQPVVTMVIRGSAQTTSRAETKFDIQTTVSAYTPNLSFP